MIKKLKNQSIALVLALALFSCVNNKKTGDVNLIPQPVQLTKTSGVFEFKASTKIIVNEKSFTKAAKLFSDRFQKASGMNLAVESGNSSASNTIFVTKSSVNKPEYYNLKVTGSTVTIEASDYNGAIYAFQTIRQLLPAQIESTMAKGVEWTIPAVEIADNPRFAWRGMHLDVSRHFFSKEYVKKFIDRLVLYKMNKFHWHLTDDQGWRIEIKKYPELTEKGAFREKNNHDRSCDESAKTNPDMVITPELFTKRDGKTVYGGFYTQEDIKEIVAYATERGITIVPEIDMPGHFKAAIDNYPEVSCFGKAGWGHTFSAPLCAGREEAFTLLENILSEVIDLFPSEFIHIGADEVEKTNWKKCKKCQARIKKEGLKDEFELQSYLVKRIEKFLNSKGRKMIGWDEIIEGGLSKTATMMFWRGWVPEAPIEAAHNGNNVIMSPTSHCYYDYAQNAGTLEHVYNFDPVPEKLKGKYEKYIIGGQANIWTEYIPSEARCDYMYMPRMVALSEALWTPLKTKSYKRFFKDMGSHFNRMDVMGINYRMPDIGGLYDKHVFVDKSTVKFTSVIPNQEIRYTTDGSTPDKNSTLYSGPFEVSKTVTVKARPISATGRGGDIISAQFEKQGYNEALNQKVSKNGLKCQYFEKQPDKRWRNVADLGKVDIKKGESVTPNFVAPKGARRTTFATIHDGFIKIEKDAVYTFSLLCDDAGVLKIDDKIVVDNDGMHAPRKKTGQIALKKGIHKINLQYIEGGGGGTLKLTMLQNGEFETIPDAMLFQ